MAAPRERVHLIGSVPLSDCEQVFRRVAGELAPYLKRIPDGETGERARWIYFQRNMLEAHPAMEIDTVAPPLRLHQWDGKLLREAPFIRFKPDIDLDCVRFDTGYDRAARDSYAVFIRLRREGVISSGTRLQVCLPTPIASAYMYVSPASRDEYLRLYERDLLAALGRIVRAIPADDLSIQFDVCQEVLIFENYFPERPSDYKARIFAELGRLGDAVPRGVELGYHLCYGSPADEHLIQPVDMAILVELMNGIGHAVSRPLDFLHVPVPKPRTDPAYVAPLAQWRRRPETQLYIGLLHHDDEAGNRARIEAARRVVDDFGVASECGWGRGDPARLPGLLAGHRHAAETLLG
jgi:hypothetical protein